MKKKTIVFIGLVLTFVKGYAQVKIGSNATSISTNKNLEVEATNGKKMNVNKDDGRVFIENKPSASLTDSVVMRYSDGEIRQISMSRLGGVLSGYQDSDGDGIPNNTDPDDDNDGILDGADKCPTVYGCAGDTTNVATKGCPNNCSNSSNTTPSEFTMLSGNQMPACLTQISSNANQLGINNDYLTRWRSTPRAMVGNEIDIAGDYVVASGGLNIPNDTVVVYKGLNRLYAVKSGTTNIYGKTVAINSTHFFVSGDNGTTSSFIDIYDLANGQIVNIKTFGGSTERIGAMDACPKGPYLVVLTSTSPDLTTGTNGIAHIFKRQTSGFYNKLTTIALDIISSNVQINDNGDFVINYSGSSMGYAAYTNNGDVWTKKIDRKMATSNTYYSQISLDNSGIAVAVSRYDATANFDSVYYYKINTGGNLATANTMLINTDIKYYELNPPTAGYFHNPWGNSTQMMGQTNVEYRNQIGFSYLYQYRSYNDNNDGRRGFLFLSNCFLIFIGSESHASIYKFDSTKTSLKPIGGFSNTSPSGQYSFYLDKILGVVDFNTNIAIFGQASLVGGNSGPSYNSKVSYLNLGCDGGCN